MPSRTCPTWDPEAIRVGIPVVLQLPAQIDRYEVVEHVSTGGMAQVFRGLQRGVDDFERPVAIKLILSHLAEDPEFIQMFQQEASLAAQLHHSKICQIFKLGRFQDTYFMALEYVSWNLPSLKIWQILE